MKKIVIIGGGFAGLSAAKVLAKSSANISVTLVDKKDTSDFLPVLPDCVGRHIEPHCLFYPIQHLGDENRFSFLKYEVTEVNFEEKKVYSGKRSVDFDYLIIASGSETDFHGDKTLLNNAYKADGVDDIVMLTNVLKEGKFDNYIICGGGYTGVELASNLSLFLKKEKKKDKKIVLVERADTILGPLPDWMKKYAEDNLKRLGVEVLTGISVEKTERNLVALHGGRVYDNAILIWAGGVKTAPFLQNMAVEKDRQGRVRVEPSLRIRENCFVAGDAANFAQGDSFLRMAVQFAIYEGKLAAENVLRSLKGKAPKRYKPFDLGYIIPMANNRSCGVVLGIKLKGFIPTLMHFMMCIYRSYGMRNKTCLFFEFIKGI